MQWHLYCRVVDNFGDIGFAWRLATDLAARGEAVRLAVDDASALAWMAPDGTHGVEVTAWDEPATTAPEVVVELFGGGLPDGVPKATTSGQWPVVVNVEHLSAEPYVARCHGLPSPRRADDGRLFTAWFFYPGFDEGTGGLIRETGLFERRAAFDAAAWLAAAGITTRPGERRVSLFGYANDAVGPLIDALAAEPTLLLLATGAASDGVATVLGPSLSRRRLRAVRLPYLTQPGFDHLLWSCELNLVRGEDSTVRAIWAGAPFLWQLYPQGDDAHATKLAAFLDRFLEDAPPGLATTLRPLFANWNGLGGGSLPSGAFDPPALVAWAAHVSRWRDVVATPPDLVRRLIEFVESKR